MMLLKFIFLYLCAKDIILFDSNSDYYLTTDSNDIVIENRIGQEPSNLTVSNMEELLEYIGIYSMIIAREIEDYDLFCATVIGLILIDILYKIVNLKVLIYHHIQEMKLIIL